MSHVSCLMSHDTKGKFLNSVGHGSVPRRPLFPDQVELHWGGTANNGLPVSFYFSKEKPGKKAFKKYIFSPYSILNPKLC